MSAQCSTCKRSGSWTGSRTSIEDGTMTTTDTYQCGGGHSWTSTVTY